MVDEPVHVLWTGGWDSTYRVLDLVLQQQRTVQPWYLVHEPRGGLGAEVAAMRDIRRAVAARSADAAARVRPTRYVGVDELAPDPQATRWLEELRRIGWIGEQYEWLYRFAIQRLPGVRVEMGLVAGGSLWERVSAESEIVEGPIGPTWRLRDQPVDPALALFAPFDAPLLGATKLDIAERAVAAGFFDILALTWFCLTPRDGQPCGVCNPCRFVDEFGLGWRLSRRARWRRRYVDLRARLRAMLGRLRG